MKRTITKVSYSRLLSGGRSFLAVASLTLLIASSISAQDFTRWVNPFIGTGGHGHTFPGATMPFGMVQLSPDTRIDNWDGSSGYHYSDDTIYGFSHTHLSGTGIPDGCDILFMPTVGEPQFFAKEGDKSVNGYASKFSHANEKAEPGYYSVKLDDDRVVAELTSTTRVGLHRYSFPTTTEKPTVILDLVWRDKIFGSDSKGSLYQQAQNPANGLYLKMVSKTRIEGYRRSSSWAKDQIVYFVAEFSKPFYPTISAVNKQAQYLTHPDEKSKNGVSGNNIKAAFQFEPLGQEQLLVKVAISYVSIEGARKNLAAELPHWDFDKVRADAKSAWNKELSKIEVSGGTDAQTTNFYTSLYHTMIQPNVFSDVDGRYKGHDGKVHQLPNFPLAERRSSASPETSKKTPDGYAANVGERRQSRENLNESGRKSIGSGTKSMPVLRSATVPLGEKSFPLGEGASANLKSKIQNPKSGEHYSVFSLWDTFRGAHPLYTIIDERRTVDFINTFIRIYEQGGRLPVWELWGEETDTMIGYHAVSVIADAMAKGIKGFDYEKAYAAAKHSAELDHLGLKDYKRRGYISMEDEHEGVSKTLEYAYNDWCITKMAKILLEPREAEIKKGFVTSWNEKSVNGLKDDIDKYSRRARYFENLFDPSTGFMRPKKNGGWVSPFAPNEVTFNFTEGNSWVYSFFVPHDVSRLMQLHGGEAKFEAKLDQLFTTTDKLAGREQPDITGLIGQYAHGNEPSHHIAYLFNYAHKPWKTQKYVRQIMDEFYKPQPDGLIGNEDCGQMSAWYILSASGFYPVNPGDGIYAFGTPLFPEMTYKLENGKTFTIKAKNVSSTNKYILNAKLNGAPYKKAFITHDDMRNGGVLEFSMIDQPVATAFNEFPMSKMGIKTVAVPVIDGGARVFQGKTTVTLSTITPRTNIYYTVNGKTLPNGEWMLYKNPLEITETTEIKAVAVDDDAMRSYIAEAKFIAKPNDWTVNIEHKYSRQYTGGGDEGLIDGIRGTVNFASGEWQGYQPKDLIAIIDLQRETTISELGGGFLQNARSWIWMPTRIVFETSIDGVTFTKAAEIKTDIDSTDMKEQIKDYMTTISLTQARYVKVHAYNLGKIPAWHPGAGYDTYIFVDEIIIK